MSKLVVLALTLSACATSSGLIKEGTEAGPRAKVRLGLTATAGTQHAYPELIDPKVTAIDRLSHSIRSRLGASATAEIDLCTAPSGRVTKVAIAKSSSFDAFDGALLSDAGAWQFAAIPGPDTVQSCRRTTVTYHVH